MTVTNDRRFGHLPIVDPESLIARLSPLSPIGDISTATFTEDTAETVTWETQTDFDAGSYVHADAESGTLEMGRSDGFEDNDTVGWTIQDLDGGSFSTQTGTVFNGTYAVDCVSGGGTWDNAVTFGGSGDGTLGGDVYAEVWLNEPSGNDARTQLIFAFDGTGDHYMIEGTAEIDVAASIKDEGGNLVGSNENNYNRSYNTWYRLTTYWRPSSGDITGTIYDTGGSQLVQNTASGSKDDGQIGLAVYRNNTYYDDFFYRRTNARWTSATKSFSGPATPDLQNLSYTLNGETIDLDIIGSPGTASEEVVTQTLDGANSYSLTWSNAHTDFKVRPDLSTSDPRPSNTHPTLSRVELSGSV